MRLRPIIAIAHRDLRLELRGARGLVLGAITAALLLPLAAVRFDGPAEPQPQVVPEIPIVGDLPPNLPPEVVLRAQAPTKVEALEGGTWQIRGAIPRPLRKALDETDPRPVTLEVATKPLHLPGRTLLFALISASIMMGALSESLAGERARRTLSTLLAAAVTPMEVVLGKWLAWTGYGTVAALVASGLAIARGAVEPGSWLIPVPFVPAVTVALGLYLVRRARDVVAGATISLRVLPALLMASGLTAWFAGRIDPMLGAAVPIGGALLTAGATWPVPAAPFLAIFTTGLTTAALLAGTARDLSDDLSSEKRSAPWLEALFITVVAGAAWVTPIVGPELWAIAGNPTLAAGLPADTGAGAGGLALCLLAAWWVSRARIPESFTRPPIHPGTMLLAALSTWAISTLPGVLALPLPIPIFHQASLRLTDATLLTDLASIFVVVLGQEWVFRGILQRKLGPWTASAACAVALAPLDPLFGLAMALPLAALAAHSGSWLPGAMGRMIAMAVLALLPASQAWMAGFVVLPAGAWLLSAGNNRT